MAAEQPCGKRMKPTVKVWLLHYEKRHGKLGVSGSPARSESQRDVNRPVVGTKPVHGLERVACHATGEFAALANSRAHRAFGCEMT